MEPPVRARAPFHRERAGFLPVGVATCRSAARHAEVGAGGVSGNCDFVVVLDPDRNLPAIAGQTTLPDGRPLVAFSHAIVEGAANADELAFVLGHEVAHHVADHAPRQIARIDEAAAGAGRTLVAEGDEASSPASLSRVERPALGGAESRASLRGFELEADRLGSRIAAAAGYDEARGVRILGRLEGRPGDYCLLMRTREAAVSDALSGDA